MSWNIVTYSFLHRNKFSNDKYTKNTYLNSVLEKLFIYYEVKYNGFLL